MRVAGYYKLVFLQAVIDEFCAAIGPGSVLLTCRGHPDKKQLQRILKFSSSLAPLVRKIERATAALNFL
jgi:hypothetical protein